MTILIDRTVGDDATVFSDLLEIARCDPGLATFEYTPYVYWLTYIQKKAAVPSSTRLLALVNSTTTILIVGVGSTSVLPNGLPLSAYGGAATLNDTASGEIAIWYDVTDAGGDGITVLDTVELTIYAPRQVNLYHELSHAYHAIQRDLPTNPHDAEIQGHADENIFRAQLGLPARHPTNEYAGRGKPVHGDASFPSCQPKETGWSPGWKCTAAVATAALGSPDAQEIVELRRARHEYRNLSLWTAMIADPALNLYGKFSPGVVRDMQNDPLLLKTMLLYAVQPTVHLLHIAETYLAAETDTSELAANLDRSFADYVSELARAGGSALALRDAGEGASMASRLLAAGDSVSLPPAGDQLPHDLFPYLAGAVGKYGGPTTAFAWAFEGLALFLRHAAARFADGACVEAEFLHALGGWAARLPMPPHTQLTISDARRELAVLGEHVFTRADVRERFAQHLLAQWPSSSAPALRSVLSVLQYLRPDHDTTE